MKPLVSIYVASYNHENFIERCINGILNQKVNFIYEVIIHDDYSTDNTLKILRKYEKKYPNIFKNIYQKQNKFLENRSVHLSNQVNNCKGKFIALCDGDDYWTDLNKLQKQVDFLQKKLDYNACVHNTDLLKNGKIKKKEWRWDSTRTSFTAVDYIYSLFFHTSSIVFRAKEIKKISFDKDILQGDIYLFLSVINDKKVFFINQSMSVYRIHDGGITNSPKNRSNVLKYKSLLLIFKKFNSLSNYKFKNIIWLKKQTINSLLFLDDQAKEKKPFLRLKYYIFKIILLMSVKINAKFMS